MTDTTSDNPAPQPRAHLRRAVVPMALAAFGTLACWWAAGGTLGLFLGVAFVVALVAPAMAAGVGRTPSTSDATAANADGRRLPLLDGLLTVGAVADGAGLVLLAAVFGGILSLAQWLLVYVVLLSFAAAMLGLVSLLVRLRVPRAVAGALVTGLGVAWLTWPVWLSHALTDTLVDILVPCHPLMAINAAVRHLGLWSEQAGVVYHLTSLNQDVPYALPTSVWPAVLLHAMVCVAGFLPRVRRAR